MQPHYQPSPPASKRGVIVRSSGAASVGKDDKDDSDDSKKRLKAVSHAGKSLIPNHADKEPNISSHADKESTPDRRTYADVLRGCEGPKANVAYVNGTVGKDNDSFCRGSTDGVVCANKIGDGVASTKEKSNNKKGTEDAVTFLI
ncbi:hypothetical protein IV203_005792 [Nitzschia inconspicua]|uniref:Uncharacterized protein n=1 Tax=Nitzschia inconspicua TaxID=303405 RepID=A0A9K3PGP5_9STRA|nr:hypothetical protein IV203_005792 [Nitzschia inconspicua]